MERLILCGGGHVSLELAHIAARLEFELIVVDDRAEFANVARFPMAAQVICAPFLEGPGRVGQPGGRLTTPSSPGATPLTGSAWSTCSGGSTPMWA